MARFDIYSIHGFRAPLMDVQSDLLAHLPTRVVIPFHTKDELSLFIPRLHLPMTIEGKSYYLATNMMAVVRKSSLKRRIGNVAHQSHEITAAIDFLLQGF